MTKHKKLKFAQSLIAPLLSLYMALMFIPETEITGTVRLTGTSLFQELVITTAENVNYTFDQSLFEDFVDYQHQTITVKAKVKDRKLTLADGSKTFIIPTIYTAIIVK